MPTETLPRYIEVEQTVAKVAATLPIDDPMMPNTRLAPRESANLTPETFRAMALDLFRALLHLTNLAPSSHVLDVGSGVGRAAMPLTRFLTDGSYTGVDVMADLVDDARERIGSRHPNFRFEHVDVYSGMYNEGAELQPSALRFDFPDQRFDTIFLFSVFSHMFPDDVATYLGEFRRLLKTGGIVLATFFLLTPRAEQAIRDGRSKYKFEHAHGKVRINNRQLPEGAVAYPPEVLNELIGSSGLELLHISDGSWTGYARALTGQDAVICRRN